jgi:hypothetical protein
MKRSGSVSRVVAVLALCLAPAWSSWAATDATLERGSGLKPGVKRHERTLTVAELRACIDIKADAGGLASRIHHQKMSADVAENRYRGLDQQLNAAIQVLDRTDQGGIDDYNRLVREQGAAVDEYNALVGRLNDMIDEHDAMVARFNANCTGHYYAADLTQAYSQREREIAAAQAER